MALMKQVSVDGEDVDINAVSNIVLLNLIRFVDADLVAVSLSEGLPLSKAAKTAESEPYRKMRLRQLTNKRKSLLLEARRRKLEVE